MAKDLSRRMKRIVLKLSGEALKGQSESIFDEMILTQVGEKIKELVEKNIEVAIVVGGGNLWRGRNNSDMSQVTSDNIGMISTVVNALAVSDFIKIAGCKSEVLSSVPMPKFCEYFTAQRADELLKSKTVVVFAGGTGNPYFSTDTTSALRAAEIKADVILLGKMGVDAVYDSDPAKNPNAVRITSLTYKEIIEKDLKVMDATAASLCMNTSVPIVVFGIEDLSNIDKILNGENIGTIIKEG